CICCSFFFFQAEDGIRVFHVTGVQTCALPISDKHWMTSTRLALGTEGTKSLRGMPQVIHRQISLGPDEHLVELEVDTSRIRNTAVGVGAGVAVAGVVSGVAVAAGVPGGNDLLQFLTAAV